jgi:hypothetical protein
MKIDEPVKLTPEVSLKLEQAAAIDATWEECAFYAGISVATLYNWLESVEGLRERLEALRKKPVLKARQTVVSSLDTPSMALEYLKCKRKDEFAQRSETTGADGKSLLEPLVDEIKSLGEGLRLMITNGKRIEPDRIEAELADAPSGAPPVLPDAAGVDEGGREAGQ